MTKWLSKFLYGSVLLVTLVLLTGSVGATIHSYSENHNRKSSPWGASWIDVYAQEKYGTKDHPQYRPLGNVTLTLWNDGFLGLPRPLLKFLIWRQAGETTPVWFVGITNVQGQQVIPSIYEGSYSLFGYKDGYVDLHYKWGVSVSMDGTPGSATITLTAKGNIWAP
jgi:hypothetical protein